MSVSKININGTYHDIADNYVRNYISKLKTNFLGRSDADALYAKKTDISTLLTGYATEDWVTNKGYIDSLDGYATEQWVLNKGYIDSLDGYATESWVNSSLNKYLPKSDVSTTLAGYATEEWVLEKNYISSTASYEVVIRFALTNGTTPTQCTLTTPTAEDDVWKKTVDTTKFPKGEDIVWITVATFLTFPDGTNKISDSKWSEPTRVTGLKIFTTGYYYVSKDVFSNWSSSTSSAANTPTNAIYIGPNSYSNVKLDGDTAYAILQYTGTSWTKIKEYKTSNGKTIYLRCATTVSIYDSKQNKLMVIPMNNIVFRGKDGIIRGANAEAKYAVKSSFNAWQLPEGYNKNNFIEGFTDTGGYQFYKDGEPLKMADDITDFYTILQEIADNIGDVDGELGSCDPMNEYSTTHPYLFEFNINSLTELPDGSKTIGPKNMPYDVTSDTTASVTDTLVLSRSAGNLLTLAGLGICLDNDSRINVILNYSGYYFLNNVEVWGCNLNKNEKNDLMSEVDRNKLKFYKFAQLAFWGQMFYSAYNNILSDIYNESIGWMNMRYQGTHITTNVITRDVTGQFSGDIEVDTAGGVKRYLAMPQIELHVYVQFKSMRIQGTVTLQLRSFSVPFDTLPAHNMSTKYNTDQNATVYFINNNNSDTITLNVNGLSNMPVNMTAGLIDSEHESLFTSKNNVYQAKIKVPSADIINQKEFELAFTKNGSDTASFMQKFHFNLEKNNVYIYTYDNNTIKYPNCKESDEQNYRLILNMSLSSGGIDFNSTSKVPYVSILNYNYIVEYYNSTTYTKYHTIYDSSTGEYKSIVID